jgi:hypothetical protein
MDAMLRYIFMSHKFVTLAHRATHFLESTMLVDNTLGSLSQQIEDKIKNLQITSSASTVPTYVLASPRNHTNTHANALGER